VKTRPRLTKRQARPMVRTIPNENHQRRSIDEKSVISRSDWFSCPHHQLLRAAEVCPAGISPHDRRTGERSDGRRYRKRSLRTRTIWRIGCAIRPNAVRDGSGEQYRVHALRRPCGRGPYRRGGHGRSAAGHADATGTTDRQPAALVKDVVHDLYVDLTCFRAGLK
jgi:hypothetical protein